MTVAVSLSSTVALCDGVTTVFSFDFIGAVAADIVVSVTDSDGTITVLDPSVYTIALNAADPGQLWGVGGTVTYPIVGTPLQTGSTITMTRALPYTQEISISNQGAFYPQAVEEALDLLEMQIQQLYDLQSSGSTSAEGNVVGPASSSNYGVAYFIGTNGQRLGSTAAGPAGYLLTGNGSGSAPNWQLPPGQASGVLGTDTYTPGDHVLDPPTGATFGLVSLIGGGGGGQGAAGNPGTGKVAVGTGGSGAGWLQVLVSASSIDGETLHVGDFGAGGAAGDNAGADGEDTTLLTYTAEGGLGGILGTTSSTPPYTAHSMTGGSVSGSSLASQRPGGASGNETTTTTSAAYGGSGGDSQFSPGTLPASCAADSQANGAAAAGFGGGGGGGVASGTGVSASGGNGSSGSATIIWYGFTPANQGASGEATQAEEEAGVLGTVYTSPRVQQFHDSAAKVAGYIMASASGASVTWGYNIASVSRDSEGLYTITFTNPFLTDQFVVLATPDQT